MTLLPSECFSVILESVSSIWVLSLAVAHLSLVTHPSYQPLQLFFLAFIRFMPFLAWSVPGDKSFSSPCAKVYQPSLRHSIARPIGLAAPCPMLMPTSWVSEASSSTSLGGRCTLSLVLLVFGLPVFQLGRSSELEFPESNLWRNVLPIHTCIIRARLDDTLFCETYNNDCTLVVCLPYVP